MGGPTGCSVARQRLSNAFVVDRGAMDVPAADELAQGMSAGARAGVVPIQQDESTITVDQDVQWLKVHVGDDQLGEVGRPRFRRRRIPAPMCSDRSPPAEQGLVLMHDI